MDARSEQANEILRDMGVDPETYSGVRSSAVLKESFDKKAAADDGRMEKLILTVKKNSPTGRQILEEAEKKSGGLNLAFDNALDCVGMYVSENKALFLNPVYSDEELAVTLVHEARHSLQTIVQKGNLKSLIVSRRAREADAMAFECATAYEMKEKVPGCWPAFKDKHKSVAVPYEKEAEKDKEKALGAAFKGWFDDASYTASYDRSLLQAALCQEIIDPDLNYSSEKIMSLSSPGFQGKPYVSASFLETDKALTVKRGVAFSMRMVGLPVKDSSIYQMKIKHLSGQAAPLKQKGFSATAAAFLAPRER